MWITITKKLPTPVSPPVLSLHWAEPVTSTESTRYNAALRIMQAEENWSEWQLEEALVSDPDFVNDLIEHTDYYWDGAFGLEQNREKAVEINYEGKGITVLPGEYTICLRNTLVLAFFNPPNDNGEFDDDDMAMHLFLNPSETTRALSQMENTPEIESLIDDAILNGGSPQQVRMTLLGIPLLETVSRYSDENKIQPDLPNIGWFCPPPLIANHYGFLDHPIYEGSFDEETGEYVGWPAIQANKYDYELGEYPY